MKKPRLTLAEAISLGCKHEPATVQGECKIIERALQSVGALPLHLDDHSNYTPEQLRTLGYSHSTLTRLYPWLKEKLLCPWCAEEIEGTAIVEHTYIEHVRQHETTAEEQSQWLQEMEEELDRPLSVAIYFKTARERDAVLWAAQRQQLTLNAFLASAVRLVLQHRLVMTEFACPDPSPMKE